jgi:hypothetical protein
MRAVREWGGTKARTEKTAPTESDTEQWLSTGVNQKIALSNNRRPTSREERVCPWRIGVVDTQCSINPRVYREGTLYRKRGIATAWRMVLGTRSDFNGGEVGRYGRCRGPASFLVEAQLLENGSLSPNGLSARAGSKPEERIDPSDPVGVHSLENGSLFWNGCPSRERRTGCQIELACGVPGDAEPPVLWRMVL